MAPAPDNDDWIRHKEAVLRDLERLSEEVLKLRSALHDVRDKLGTNMIGLSVEVGKLQVRAGIWGALGGVLGSIGAASVLLISYLLTNKH